jgi:transposase
MQINLFAEETQLERLGKLGDSLERLKIIDFESFRPTLTDGLKKERKSRAGRPSFDHVMMFKVLVLQRLFNLSDEQTEYQITDRMSFQRFLGLSLGEKVPDAKTIWVFRNTLTESGSIENLFSQFNRMLEERGIITHKGTIVDATFVDAPRQRNSHDENEKIKNVEIPEDWKKNNRRKSKICCRIEHVFVYMTMSMHGLTVRSIGIERAAFNIGLTNLVYNLCRYSFLSRKEAVAGYLYPFVGYARNFGAPNPKQYMKFEAGMRFAALISFFAVESQNLILGTNF